MNTARVVARAVFRAKPAPRCDDLGPFGYHVAMIRLLGLVLSGWLIASAQAPAWHQVHLTARKLFMKAEASITLERCSVSSVAHDLLTPPLGLAVIPTTGMVDVIRIEADLPFGRSESIVVWVDAATGAVLQNEKRRFGHGDYWKVRRYTGDGYYEWRTEPDLAEDAQRAPPRWSDRWEHQLVLTPPPPPGAVVIDPYSILAILPVVEKSAADLYVISRSTAVQVRLKRLSSRDAHGDGLIVWPGGSRDSSFGRATAFRLEVVPKEGVDADDVETGLFGLRGSCEILVDPGTAVPFEIMGKAKSIGRVRIRLDRATLAAPPGR